MDEAIRAANCKKLPSSKFLVSIFLMYLRRRVNAQRSNLLELILNEANESTRRGVPSEQLSFLGTSEGISTTIRSNEGGYVVRDKAVGMYRFLAPS